VALTGELGSLNATKWAAYLSSPVDQRLLFYQMRPNGQLYLASRMKCPKMRLNGRDNRISSGMLDKTTCLLGCVAL
jgi:hypothetical protein